MIGFRINSGQGDRTRLKIEREEVYADAEYYYGVS
jgi:hypothetical protein